MNPAKQQLSNLSETEDLHIHLALSQDRAADDASSPPMPLPPNTTPVPNPVFMPGMSHQTEAPAATTPTPTPSSKDQSTSVATTPTFDLPRLRLHIQEINHPGSSVFLSAINASTVLKTSIESIYKYLYLSTSTPTSRPYPPPPTRSVTLILRPMDGVAYTTGSDLDPEHKEIHFSLPYISTITPPTRQTSEITGIITHELVHCYQHTGRGFAPSGLIEGVADWVRLQCELAPPHWNPAEVPAKWDAGYQHTAYFLQYLEDRFGAGTVPRLNEKLRTDKYVEKAFWTELVGGPVEQLFKDYIKTLQKDGDKCCVELS
ncbi:BSP-domain-containing protein [Hypoxylon fragiforme]|uniref:BSP-domain-containing protein n=1 Tax=Hypoxylon fragiforme TaxID=63214 RepID=UPI0020C66E78|nr:BSP-domain-containing protein [Hypoxylon fragiforme]KAI2607585.1 BSP-domain-containing protein [Hypoxylon fragiforme]